MRSIKALVHLLICLFVSSATAETTATMNRAVYILQLNGVCDDCATAVQKMLKYGGIGSRIINADQITTTVRLGVDVIIVPGGQDYDLAMDDLRSHKADRVISRHVNEGGIYIGHCLGADMAPLLNIFSGEVTDPAPNKKPQPARTLWNGGTSSRWMYFEDGPLLKPTMPVRVVATYANTDAEQGMHSGDPAAIIYKWGKGTVGLVSPHPEADDSWLAKIENFPDLSSYDLGIGFFHQVLKREQLANSANRD